MTDADADVPECPECGSSSEVYENPVIDGTYQCSKCVIAFDGDGEVQK